MLVELKKNIILGRDAFEKGSRFPPGAYGPAYLETVVDVTPAWGTRLLNDGRAVPASAKTSRVGSGRKGFPPAAAELAEEIETQEVPAEEVVTRKEKPAKVERKPAPAKKPAARKRRTPSKAKRPRK